MNKTIHPLIKNNLKNNQEIFDNFMDNHKKYENKRIDYDIGK